MSIREVIRGQVQEGLLMVNGISLMILLLTNRENTYEQD